MMRQPGFLTDLSSTPCLVRSSLLTGEKSCLTELHERDGKAMPPEDSVDAQRRLEQAIDYLLPYGFIHVGNWRFSKDCRLHDLSASDLTQIQRIEREGLALVHV